MSKYKQIKLDWVDIPEKLWRDGRSHGLSSEAIAKIIISSGLQCLKNHISILNHHGQDSSEESQMMSLIHRANDIADRRNAILPKIDLSLEMEYNLIWTQINMLRDSLESKQIPDQIR